ncbi:hypothetical protein ElyMa_006872800 [Elysia marginata]|uniref:C2 NT-type domain-containing protein n=1 Tax=Elysia marginata TaxID=1093978 RepID=A0AAV4JEJ9_9GAST|nr:hypothetical protein ElyMa_006872800 [Elysia marginata]
MFPSATAPLRVKLRLLDDAMFLSAAAPNRSLRVECCDVSISNSSSKSKVTFGTEYKGLRHCEIFAEVKRTRAETRLRPTTLPPLWASRDGSEKEIQTGIY